MEENDKKFTANFTSNLNYQGIFLEFALLDFIQKYKPFIFNTQVPYTLFYEGIQPIYGVIDFLCQYVKPNDPCVYFIFECKKANPSLTEWVFFKRNNEEAKSSVFYRFRNKQTINHKIYPPFYKDVCDRGYQITHKKTQSFSNIFKDPIFKSSMQVSEGFKSVIINDQFLNRALDEKDTMPLFYVPVVITTANLYICETDVGSIDIETGEANSAGIKYTKQDWLEFSFPLPEYLQVRGCDRRNIYIVNIQNLNIFLNTIVNNLRFSQNAINM